MSAHVEYTNNALPFLHNYARRNAFSRHRMFSEKAVAQMDGWYNLGQLLS